MLNILYQFDEKYAPFAGVSILSLFENNQDAEGICIYIIECGISSESKQSLTKLAEDFSRQIVFLPSSKLEEECASLNLPTYRGSMAANLRLFADRVIPGHVKRLIYLDSDTIVCGSISELSTIDLQGKPLGMVQDSLVRGHKKHIGIGRDCAYFNSGMLVYDMDAWRDGSWSERMVDHIKNVRSSYPNPDQDLLNVVFFDNIHIISPKYNFQPIHRAFPIDSYYRIYGLHGYYSKDEITEAARDPRVLHFFRFVGQFPWHKDSLHPDREIFDSYMKRMNWKGFEKWPDEGSLVFSLERAMYKILPSAVFMFIFHISHEIFTYLADKKSK